MLVDHWADSGGCGDRCGWMGVKPGLRDCSVQSKNTVLKRFNMKKAHSIACKTYQMKLYMITFTMCMVISPVFKHWLTKFLQQKIWDPISWKTWTILSWENSVKDDWLWSICLKRVFLSIHQMFFRLFMLPINNPLGCF
jgi:hypothetical protein